VILTEECWRNRFGADEGILGQSLLLSGTPYTVVGVARAPLPRPISFVQLIVPRALDGVGLTREQLQSGVPFLEVTARLKPGVDFRAADREVRALSQRYQDAFPGNLDGGNRNELRFWVEEIVGPIRPTLLVLLGAVALVLLIACANVSNLFLGRLAARQKEIAVRLSLGATRGALVRQFLVETALFCVAATALGLVIAEWSLAAARWLFAGQLPAAVTFGLDGTTLAFTAGVSVLSCVAIGFLPALQASRAQLSDALKQSTRGSSGGPQGARFRAGLVVAEVALSALLLVGSCLLFTSFLKLQSASPGFDPRGSATSAINLPSARYGTPTEQYGAIARILEQLEAHPQVRRAAAGSSLPVGFLSGAPRAPYAVQGRPVPPADRRSFASLVIASDDYFATLGIPVKSGRAFTTDDRLDTPLAAVVNESFARKLFPNEDPLGRVILRGPSAEFAHQIVGVVGDVKSRGLNSPAPDTLYVSLRQVTVPFVTLVARTDRDPQALQDIFRGAVRDHDRTIAVTLFQTLEGALRQTFDSQRIVAALTSIFAAIALLLSMLGLYSVLAYAITQRTHEIGIRMALGATRHRVVAMVLSHGMRLVLVGLLLGLTTALGTAQFLQRLLFEVQPLDPLVYLGVTIVFLAVSALACLLPARRAARVDPLVALRAD
jgi:putative ABC transport system permease protein